MTEPMTVARNHGAELVYPLLVGDYLALVITPVDAFAVSMAESDRHVRYRAAVDAGDPPADTHALAAVARLPQVDHLRLAAVGLGIHRAGQHQSE